MLTRAPIAVTLVLLAALATYVVAFPPGEVGDIYLEQCPMELAGLPGTILSLEQTVLDDLRPDGILSRRYDRPDGLPVWLVIVYFENARTRAHDPQLCYRSQGFEVMDLPEHPVETSIGTVPLQVFQATRGARNEKVSHFWYTAGETAIGEMQAFRDSMFLQGLLKNRSFGAFVRISTLETDDAGTADRVIEEFTRELAGLLPQFFPEPES